MSSEENRKRAGNELSIGQKLKASFSGYGAEQTKDRMLSGRSQLDALKQRKAKPTG